MSHLGQRSLMDRTGEKYSYFGQNKRGHRIKLHEVIDVYVAIQNYIKGAIIHKYDTPD